MRFIGSKANLLNRIKAVIDQHCDESDEIFCDLFSGTGAVARYFKPYYQIISNDILSFSHILTAATIENNEKPRFEKLLKEGICEPITYLENERFLFLGKQYITDTYSPAGKDGRMYFTEENARRIDFIRSTIEGWKNEKLINAGEYKYLLACLIEGVPFISNITGTYGAYLKHWDKRAYKKFEMYRINIIDNNKRNICYNEDANELIKKIKGDILYIDPPYNERQYLPNYHVLETIARYDSPKATGITGMRPYGHEKSDYCMKANVEAAFSNLIADADFKHIIVSYSDDGLLSVEQILTILRKHCRTESVDYVAIPYARYKGKLEQKQKEHNEYIFYASKYATKKKISSVRDMSIAGTTAIDKKRFVKSPMNYIGGKYKILPQLFDLFPNDIDTFIDLFAGGFNVSANIKAKKTICNDMNHKVVEMVRTLCYADIEIVLRRIDDKIQEFDLSKENEVGYKAFRDCYNATGNPIDLFTLSCFSFNYQFRFNSKLEYNNPFGRNRSQYSEITKKNLILFMEEMKRKRLEFFARDFRSMDIDGLSNNDFIYCDPPYLITNGSYNDGNRGFHDWGEEEERDLCKFLDGANKRTIRFALSNVFIHKNRENKILIDWAKKYKVHYIDSDYSNCNYQFKEKAAETVEVLITNY
ncbi:MAG: Dam family site-specific DNA-(adenine-N6)-methyltransferase [Clostridiales bacterium]|jgi:adenine-specific DNA-methyltransferase|nr:Dam family site-specific DNA-(adenine-N6)-methyltransferase [Clostridiales bacterium]